MDSIILIISVRSEENGLKITTKTWGHCSTLSILVSLLVRSKSIEDDKGRYVGTGKKLCWDISYWEELYTFG